MNSTSLFKRYCTRTATSSAFRHSVHCALPAKRMILGASRRSNQSSEPEVRLDGEEDERPTSQGVSGFGINQVAGGFNMVAAKITDFAVGFVPPGTPVIVVERCVKLGLVLGAVAIINSFLNVILTMGSIALLLYVATRVFGVQIFSESAAAEGRAGQSTTARPPLPSSRRRRDRDEDVIDVWYDDK